MEIAGGVIVVTGASSGIGRATAHAFARRGAAVVLAARRTEMLVETARECVELGGTPLVAATDVTEEPQVEELGRRTIERFGRIDVIVNNAFAMGDMGRLEDKPSDHFDVALGVCFYGTLWGMQAAFPFMQAQGRGRIINLVSLAGVNAHPYEADYNAAKEAIRSITRTAAREWASHGVLVNAIAPFAASPAFVGFAEAAPEAAAISNTSQNEVEFRESPMRGVSSDR